ncbi:MAG: twin-arginine translocation signal domain-containing protein [Pedobacter sp.]|nr:MAG: twin-arginine translocation signal domain-containing protein [Pedobacter sp.]
MKNLQQLEEQEERSILTAPLQRRSFLQFAGAGMAGAALLAHPNCSTTTPLFLAVCRSGYGRCSIIGSWMY